MLDEKQILQNLRPSKARKRNGFFPDMSLGATTMVNWPKHFGRTTTITRKLFWQVKVQKRFVSHTPLSLNRTRLMYFEQFLFSKIKSVFYILNLLSFLLRNFLCRWEYSELSHNFDIPSLPKSSKFRTQGLDWHLTKMTGPSLNLYCPKKRL